MGVATMSNVRSAGSVNRFRPLVELQAATRTYSLGGEAVDAVYDVDLALQPGTFVSIVGPSGAGKSTLLHLVGGLDKPNSGSVVVAGKNLSRLDDNELAAFRLKSVGFVFQSFNLLPAMSAWENVAIPRLLAGERLRQAKPRAIELLNLVGMGSRVAHRPKELSGGEMQRVAIARALMMDPRIVLAKPVPLPPIGAGAGGSVVGSSPAPVAHQSEVQTMNFPCAGRVHLRSRLGGAG